MKESNTITDMKSTNENETEMKEKNIMTDINKAKAAHEASKAALAALAAAVVAVDAAKAHKSIYEVAAKTVSKEEYDVGYEVLKTAIRKSYEAYEAADEEASTVACETIAAYQAYEAALEEAA
jgi:predicted sugar kinase